MECQEAARPIYSYEISEGIGWAIMELGGGPWACNAIMEREPVLVGERIRELRIRRGQSQSSLAEQVGISQPTVSELERGLIQNVDAWIVAKLSAALQTTMDYLLGLTDDPSPRYGGPRLAIDEAVRQVLLLTPEAREALLEFLRLVQRPDDSDE